MGQVATAITEAEVGAVVQALVAAGVHPSVRLVRERLGRGSMTTITSLVGKVRTSMDLPAVPAVAMARPSPVVAVMPAPANDRLLELERELAEERGRVAELRRQVEALTAERDHALVKAAESRKMPADKALAKLIDKLEATADKAVAATAEAEGQAHVLSREAVGYHRDLLHALRAVEIVAERLSAAFSLDMEPIKLVADMDGAPPVLTAAAAKPKPKARPKKAS